MERRFGVVPVVFISACTFAAGAAASWYGFGAPRGVDLVADNGSTADWVAAISTCVVGLGACWFAYEANRHRRDEVARQEARDRVARNARLSLILDAAITYVCVEGAVISFRDPAAARRGFDDVKMALDVSAKLRTRHNWASFDKSVLDDATIMDLSRLESLQIQFDDIAGDFLAMYAEDPARFDPDKCGGLRNLIETASSMRVAAERVIADVQALRKIDVPSFA
ncbi:hypothetical protein [Stenotrophomonas indicatrix]|uniref:hypothetical protein n=1 Tax=Stenotrophomonas indicatrix TaxID=2045451 RepID=UPI00105682EA|nr:hypothetical protein [Stenotrophomonas indicatrix]